MPTIAKADFETIADRIAYIEGNIGLAVEGGTPFYKTITATEDPDVELPLGQAAYDTDIQVALGRWKEQLLTTMISGSEVHAARVSATKATAYDSLSALITALGTRAHQWFNDVQQRITKTWLTSSLVYDAVKTIGTYTGTGSGTGAYVHATALNAHSGGNNLVAVATTTATAIVLDLTCKKPDTTTEVKRVTVNGPAGTSVDIGTHGTNQYTDVPSGEIVSGGAEGQIVEVRSEEDRAPAL
jgi:hypothetical protein